MGKQSSNIRDRECRQKAVVAGSQSIPLTIGERLCGNKVAPRKEREVRQVRTTTPKPTSRLPVVKKYIKQHFSQNGEELLRNGCAVDPKYPSNRKRPRSVAIGSFGGQNVVWTVGQIRMLLDLGDLPDDAEVLYLDRNCQNDSLDNLRLKQRSADRKPRNQMKWRKPSVSGEAAEWRLPLPKGVTRWNIAQAPKGSSPAVKPICRMDTSRR
jgi:hypothetical protein